MSSAVPIFWSVPEKSIKYLPGIFKLILIPYRVNPTVGKMGHGYYKVARLIAAFQHSFEE
jgi:hypothetical protein